MPRSERKLYVMHHAPIAKRKGEIVGCRTDKGLSEYGIEVAKRQAERLRRMLGTTALEKVTSTILSSPLKRALHTSEIIAERCDLEIQTDERLKAQNFGVLDGMTFEEVERDEELRLNLWDYIPPHLRDMHRTPGGESNKEMVDRVNGFKTDILSRDQTMRPFIITHGTVIDAMIASVDHRRLDEIEGQNRKYEGRPIVISKDSYQPIGHEGDPFDFIPGVSSLVEQDDIEGIRRRIETYVLCETNRQDEKVHLEKLMNFLGNKGANS